MLYFLLTGLFQSTNLLMSRSSRGDTGTGGRTCDEFKFSYTNFEIVDHRLKAYLYQTMFEDNNENLKWLAKGRILLNTASTGQYTGIFIMSTTKFYILQITANERYASISFIFSVKPLLNTFYILVMTYQNGQNVNCPAQWIALKWFVCYHGKSVSRSALKALAMCNYCFRTFFVPIVFYFSLPVSQRVFLYKNKN